MMDAINELFASGGASVEGHPTGEMASDFQWWILRGQIMALDFDRTGCEKTQVQRLVERKN